jgi:Na+-driven multidrug efflux pump
MLILAGVIGLFASLSWIIAVIQAIRIVKLAPKGEKLGSYFALGWWKFDQIAAKAGPESLPVLETYKRAVIAFLVFVILGVLLSGWMASQTPPATPTTTSLINDPRIIPADFALNTEFRRVAMPGAPKVLES